MRKLIKTINYYDDGSYDETNWFQGPDQYVPVTPPQQTPVYNPWEIKPLIPWDIKPYNWNKPICSKCGIELSGVMGYACQNVSCPSGLNLLSSTLTTGSIVSGTTVQWPGCTDSESGL